MAIRFKCPHCKKPLAVKDHLAGKKTACPVCKKGLVIPKTAPVATPPVAAPADLEAFAAAALNEEPAEKTAAQEELENRTIDFKCPFCDEELHLPFSEAGKQSPCPECRRIIKIPIPNQTGPKDWRQLLKKGPAAALINQPEQLEDAWGTEVKTRVSGTALEEAGALPEKQEQPRGPGRWVKRAFYGLLCGALVFGLFAYLRNRGIQRQEKDAIKIALAVIEIPNKDQPGRFISKLSPLQTAEVYRGVGELYIGKDQAEKALECFRKARAVLPGEAGGTAKEAMPAPVEQDLFLADLCLSIVELGGPDEEVIAKKRFTWTEEVQTELLSTLQGMNTDEGKLMALRDLVSLLSERKQADLALSVVSSLSRNGPRFQAQQVALLVGLGKTLPKDLPKEPALGKEAIPIGTRLAYAEGYARKGNTIEALKFAQFYKSATHDRMEASLAVALLLVREKKTKDAKPFFDEALAAHKDAREAVNSWLLLQMLRVAHHLGEEEQVKDLVKKLRPEFKSRVPVEKVLGKLAQSTAALPLTVLDDFDADVKSDLKPEKRGDALARAWFALARHNARLGAGAAIREYADTPGKEDLRPILLVARALGEQDSRK